MSASQFAVLPCGKTIDITDVPVVSSDDMAAVIDHLVQSGQGLALVNGMSGDAIAALEEAIWQQWPDDKAKRLAVTLRFRALLAVFSARRLRDLVLARGYRVIKASAAVAARQRLNFRIGFRAQSILMALDRATTTASQPHASTAAQRQPAAIAA